MLVKRFFVKYLSSFNQNKQNVCDSILARSLTFHFPLGGGEGEPFHSLVSDKSSLTLTTNWKVESELSYATLLT